MAYLPGQQYVQNSAGVWTPVGYAAGATSMPVSMSAVDGAGALYVNVSGSSGGSTAAVSTGTLTAGNSTAASNPNSGTARQVVSASNAGNITISLRSTAFVGTVVFEASDDSGLNWYPVLCTREDGTGSESTLPVTGTVSRLWLTAAPGITHFAARCSAFTSGSLTVRLTPGATLLEPAPSLGASSASIGRVGPIPSGTATTGSVTPTSASATLLAANANRVGYKVWNDSNVDALINEPTNTASITAYTYRLNAGGFYETTSPMVWTGQVAVLGVAAGTLTPTTATSGALRVSEYT